MIRLFFRLFIAFLFVFHGTSAQFFQAGELDTTYNFGFPHIFLADNGPLPGTGANGTVNALAQQADGKTLFGGSFTAFNGSPRNRLARLLADGRLDMTFNSGIGINGPVWSLVVQPDGKILMGGQFSSYNGTTRMFIARLNTNGSLDSNFNPGMGVNNTINTIALQANGRVVIGGIFTLLNGGACHGLARLNQDGSVDTSFTMPLGPNSRVNNVVVQPDGKILIGGDFAFNNNTTRQRLARLNADGNPDTTFNSGTGPNDMLTALALQADGKILIGGWFTNFNGVSRNRFTRLNANGSLDLTFNTGTGTTSYLNSIVIQPDNKILLAGFFTNYNGTTQRRITRIHPDGSRDTTFKIGTGAGGTINALILQPNGKLFIGGFFTDYNEIVRNRITQLNSDGSDDLSFNPVTGAGSIVKNFVLQPNGKLMVMGNFTRFNGVLRNQIARLHPNGTLDTSFSPSIGPSGTIRSLVTLPDGKMIVAGTFIQYNGVSRGRIARIHPDGSLDMTYNVGVGANSTIWDLALQPDGKLLIGGLFTTFDGIARARIARLNADGSLDLSFDPGVGIDNWVQTIALQSDGKVLVGGTFNTVGGIARKSIARLNADGTLDVSFDTGTGPNTEVKKVILQADGKILIGGWFTSYNGVTRDRVARINTNGSLDMTFNPVPGVNSYVNTIVQQNNGQIIVGGNFGTFGGLPRAHIVRLNVDGSMDTTFNPGTGANDEVEVLALLPDGKVLVGGAFATYNGVFRDKIARVFAPSCTTAITNTTSNAAICGGATKNLIGTAGGTWVIASGPGSITGNTYNASGGSGLIAIYNLVGSCYSPLVTFTVDNPVAPTIPTTINACIGSTITITPTAGGTNYRFYADSITTTPLPGGNGVASFTTPTLNNSITYYVSAVGAAGCESMTRTAVTVNVIPLPVVNIVRLGDTLVADTAVGSYQWFKDGLAITDATSRTYLPNQSGLYRASFTNPQGCTGLSNEINVIFASLDDQSPATIVWNSYPVPFRETLTIEAAAAFSYQLLDLRGANMMQGETAANHISLSTQDLPNGIYLLKITVNGQTALRKVLRE